jgi:hypothetical protein
MNNFLPVIFAFGILVAIFLYGYLTDPYRPRAIAIQPAHGEANRQNNAALSTRRFAKKIV